jgi:hypothetical protein
VRTDETPTGLHHHFEAAVAIILPQDPVARKRVTGERPVAEIFEVNGIGNDKTKVGKGKTGMSRTIINSLSSIPGTEKRVRVYE